jgi:seryl-tRNA synthetase
MLDIKWIREKPDALVKALIKRGNSEASAAETVAAVIQADEERRAHLGKLQEQQEARNQKSKEIGNAMRAGDMAKAEALKSEVNEIKAWLSGAEQMEREIDDRLRNTLAVIPNVPLDEVPVGKDEHDNVEVRRWGVELIAERQRNMGNKPKEHFEIGEKLGMMDFERAAKLSGSRFTVLKGQLARLERALGQFMLDLHTTENGYTEVQPPLLVNQRAMFGTGNLPKFENDLFSTKTTIFSAPLSELEQPRFDSLMVGNPIFRSKSIQDSFEDAYKIRRGKISLRHLDEVSGQTIDVDVGHYLIPTAEVPLTNLVREEITPVEKLPLRFTALTPCFRSEAGSAGRDTRGMLRQHQFYKVEMVSITTQETSLEEHERMTACAEEVLKRLGLPFRTVVLCTGDMGFGSRKTYDIEVWLPGQNAYREISSCSVCGDFQARRMDARYRAKDEKQTRFVHTLNGSGVAVGRALIAVMENYQNEDGSVTIPEALRPYMGGLERIERA